MNRLNLLVFVLVSTACSPCFAQANLDQLLNRVDSSMQRQAGIIEPQAGWNLNGMPANRGMSQYPQQQSVFNSSNGYPVNGAYNMGIPPTQGLVQPGNGNLLRMLMGGGNAVQAPQPQQPPENPFSGRNLLKTFLGDTSSSGQPGAAGDQRALSSAQSYCQTARDQAQQAEDAASRASYGQKSYRLSAADEAQNHANAARAAANNATSAAAGHFLPANDAAAQARNAADRAQAAADRARYNANSGS